MNRIPSSRRLEREAGRNVELMWLIGRLVPDHNHGERYGGQEFMASRQKHNPAAFNCLQAKLHGCFPNGGHTGYSRRAYRENTVPAPSARLGCCCSSSP